MNFIDRIKNQKGAAVVEFAIVLPLLITLTFGIVEFGIIMYNKAVITNASREGARFGILFDTNVHDDAAITARVTTFLNNTSLINLGGPSPAPNISVSPASRPRGTPISVAVRYTYDFLLVPNFIPTLPQTLDLNAVTTMRME